MNLTRPLNQKQRKNFIEPFNIQINQDNLPLYEKKSSIRYSIHENMVQPEKHCTDVISDVFNDLEIQLLKGKASEGNPVEEGFRNCLAKYDNDAKGPANSPILVIYLLQKMNKILTANKV